HIVARARGPDFHVDRLLPIGDLAQLLDFDGQIVRPRPVGMAAGAALVDTLGKLAHGGDALGDLHAEQHAAAPRLGPLADHDLYGIAAAQIVGVEAVAPR